MALGLLLAVLRRTRLKPVALLASAFVEFIRDTPLLVQVFLMFFGLPEFGIRLEPFTGAWLALMIWGGAFNIENFRAGFEAVPLRYREAGLALGFGSIGTFFNVTLPIGGRIALPSSINTCVSILKNTAVLGPAIGFGELTNVAYSLDSVTFRSFEIYSILAAIYLVVVWTLSALIRALERRLALPEDRRARVVRPRIHRVQGLTT